MEYMVFGGIQIIIVLDHFCNCPLALCLLIAFPVILGLPQLHSRFTYIPDAGALKDPALLDLNKLVSIVTPWLEKCDRDHYSCQQKSRAVPERLVEISSNLRLIESWQHGDGNIIVKYATLSHCWGTKEAASSLAKTLSTNIQQHMVAIRRDELPQVFRDAIDVARALNCDYIWIDSLCIIQDSPEDWKEQSALMSEVYSNAYLSIAASALPDSSRTLFQDRVCYFSSKAYSSFDKINTLPIDNFTQWYPTTKAPSVL